MQHLFWLIPGVLAGRSGPCKDPWRIRELRSAGIGAVLSVNDGRLCHADDFARAGLLYQCVPLSPNAPPLPGDEEHCLGALPLALEFVCRARSEGLATVVHCHSGKDRTGLFLAYYLLAQEAQAPAQALESVRQVRPIAFTAPGWEDFALSVLARAAA